MNNKHFLVYLVIDWIEFYSRSILLKYFVCHCQIKIPSFKNENEMFEKTRNTQKQNNNIRKKLWHQTFFFLSLSCFVFQLVKKQNLKFCLQQLFFLQFVPSPSMNNIRICVFLIYIFYFSPFCSVMRMYVPWTVQHN